MSAYFSESLHHQFTSYSWTLLPFGADLAGVVTVADGGKPHPLLNPLGDTEQLLVLEDRADEL